MSDSTATFSQQFIAELTARYAEVPSNDTKLALNNAQRCAKGIDSTMSDPVFAELAPVILTRVRQAKHSDNKLNFVAVKVLVKLISTMQALASGLRTDLDPYTATIAANLSINGHMTNKSNYVCLSKSIEYSALDEVQTLKVKRDCSVGTSSTQASSTRQALALLGIAEVCKGKQDDKMTLCDNARAQRFVKLFGKQKKS
ncbi:MAG: hypothetical protein ACXWP0_12100 [Ktedonobacterales bacterium]